MAEYDVQIKRTLTDSEIRELNDKHWPALESLTRRYLPMVDTTRGIPCRTEFLDGLRGCWLLDKSLDRPKHELVVSGVGYAFGLILQEMFGMEWCLIEDTYGEDVSMVKRQDRVNATYKQVSIPPFNYVAKRETTQNVEVFADGFREFERMINS